MNRLKLRTFGIAIILVASTLGMSLTFSESVLSGTDQEFNESDKINSLRDNFANQSDTIKGERGSVDDVSVKTEYFFLPEIWTTIETVTSGLGSVVFLMGNAAAITGLNIPASVTRIGGVVIVGVIFAVLAAARGWDV